MVNRWIPAGLKALRGIRQHEADEALANPRRWPRPAWVDAIPVLTIWARTDAGRPLIVAVRKSGRLDQRVIGARAMTQAELAEFETWEAMNDD